MFLYKLFGKGQGCMLDYVKYLHKGGTTGILYNIDGEYHVEPKGSQLESYLKEYKIYDVKGVWFGPYIRNTIFCLVTYAGYILYLKFKQ